MASTHHRSKNKIQALPPCECVDDVWFEQEANILDYAVVHAPFAKNPPQVAYMLSSSNEETAVDEWFQIADHDVLLKPKYAKLVHASPHGAALWQLAWSGVTATLQEDVTQLPTDQEANKQASKAEKSIGHHVHSLASTCVSLKHRSQNKISMLVDKHGIACLNLNNEHLYFVDWQKLFLVPPFSTRRGVTDIDRSATATVDLVTLCRRIIKRCSTRCPFLLHGAEKNVMEALLSLWSWREYWSFCCRIHRALHQRENNTSDKIMAFIKQFVDRRLSSEESCQKDMTRLIQVSTTAIPCFVFWFLPMSNILHRIKDNIKEFEVTIDTLNCVTKSLEMFATLPLSASSDDDNN